MLSVCILVPYSLTDFTAPSGSAALGGDIMKLSGVVVFISKQVTSSGSFAILPSAWMAIASCFKLEGSSDGYYANPWLSLVRVA